MRQKTKHIVLLVMLLPLMVVAQKKSKRLLNADSLSIMRDFVAACNVYKQLPLQLTLTLKTTANFITNREDTLNMNAAFHMQSDGSYIKYGELEQLINDSLVLMVSKDVKRMVLYTNTPQINARMRQFIGIQLEDSSVQKMLNKYSVQIKSKQNEKLIMEVNNRAVLFGTILPKETIQLIYDTIKKQPNEVVQTKRTLVPIDSVSYVSYLGNPDFKNNLVAIDNHFFIVKELTSRYVYETVMHDSLIHLPVVITDRIVRMKDGRYQPSRNYETYSLNQNF